MGVPHQSADRSPSMWGRVFRIFFHRLQHPHSGVRLPQVEPRPFWGFGRHWRFGQQGNGVIAMLRYATAFALAATLNLAATDLRLIDAIKRRDRKAVASMMR